MKVETENGIVEIESTKVELDIPNCLLKDIDEMYMFGMFRNRSQLVIHILLDVCKFWSKHGHLGWGLFNRIQPKRARSKGSIVDRAMRCEATFMDVMEVSLHNPLVGHLRRIAENHRLGDRQMLCSAVVLLSKQYQKMESQSIRAAECRPVPLVRSDADCADDTVAVCRVCGAKLIKVFVSETTRWEEITTLENNAFTHSQKPHFPCKGLCPQCRDRHE